MSQLNHCQQVEAIEHLLQGFISARFDNIADLDPKVAKMTATAFVNEIILPRLELLRQTGQKMEDGLRIRKAIMSLKGLEDYYQSEKEKLRKGLTKVK